MVAESTRAMTDAVKTGRGYVLVETDAATGEPRITAEHPANGVVRTALLFAVQPMASKLDLPLLGGTPVVGLGTWELRLGGAPVDRIVSVADPVVAVSDALGLARA